MNHYFLAIDQGTTSTRAMIFDAEQRVVAVSQIPFQQYFPESGWVEHDPEEIWQSVLEVCRQAIAQSGLSPSKIAALGISNQRETTVLWHKKTGQVVAPAIVWQDRRTTNYCQQLKEKFGDIIQQKTGLLLDPYFSASKIHWLLNHYPEAKVLAATGELAFGTIESFLIYRLTGGEKHVSDISNASRTALFNIHTASWDPELLKIFEIPDSLLPEVLDNATFFGACKENLLGASIPITGAAGDQQAAMIGQACLQAGLMKTTLGTGAFLMLNTGEQAVHSQYQLLTTIAYQIGSKRHYALEGSIFNAGTSIKWLRDDLNLIQDAKETEALAMSLSSNDGVYLVPAFTGLGAPYWRADLRAMIYGLTRASSKAHFARAALEAVAYQLADVVQAMQADAKLTVCEMRLDGGLTANAWLMQFMADMLKLPVLLPANAEASCLGAALLAGIGSGLYNSLEEASKLWRATRKFLPNMSEEIRDQNYHGWREALAKIMA